MTRISIRGVVAGYGQGDILRGVDLEVEPGTITCVIGPNGAGKSTVLRAISGLLRPTRGTITLGDTPSSGRSPREVLALGAVHVPQERSLFPQMTVWENVLIGGHMHARPAAGAHAGATRSRSASRSSASAVTTAPGHCRAASRSWWRSPAR